MKIPRRRFLGLAAGSAALMAVPRPGVAQSYPTRPISLVVFAGAGGAPDIVARIVATPLSQRLGQPVVIDNRPGAGGNIALQAVARAPADGYTLLLVATPHAVNVTLYEKQEVNLLRDIVPVASIDDDAFALLVNKIAAGEYRRRADRLCQGQSRQDQHDVERHRQPEPSRGRTVQDDDRHPDGPCAVSRHARGQHRAHHRRRARDVQRAAVGAAACEGRHGARDRRDDQNARQAAAGHSRHCRDGAGLRGDRMARHRRAQRHAAPRSSTG